MDSISNAERAVLNKIYPVGCRVELEFMKPALYCKLEPGDLGTVEFIDETGQIRVAWDRGSSLALVYKVDICKCLLTKAEMQECLEKFSKLLFLSQEKMVEWLEDTFLHIFPKMFTRRAVNNKLIVELGCAAFLFQKPRISILFAQDAQGHVYVRECKMCDSKVPEKNISK